MTMVLGEFGNDGDTYYLLGLDVIGQQIDMNWSYMGYDGLGSVRQMTDWAGSLTYSANYDPYGTLIEAQGWDTSLGFTGEMSDATGLQYLRARYMDTSTGTFLTRDPIMGQVGGSSVRYNPYLYAGGNPVNYIDPDGRFFFMPLLAAAAVGAISGALIGGGLDLLMQLNENGWNTDCLDQQRLGAAMLQGFVLGAISGGVGGISAKLGMSAVSAGVFGAIADFAGGFVYDGLVNHKSLEQAAVDNLLGAGVGFGIGAVGHRVAKWFGRNANEMVERAARNFDNALGNACSFTPDTQVSTVDGKTPIGDLEVGDQVIAYDEASQSSVARTISAVMEHEDETLVTLVIEGETILTTPEHPFYTAEGWVAAGALVLGAEILSLDGTYGDLESISFTNDPQVMLNLTVDISHTFAVGEGQWVVHNTCDISSASNRLRAIFKQYPADSGKCEVCSTRAAEAIREIYPEYSVDIIRIQNMITPRGDRGNYLVAYKPNGQTFSISDVNEPFHETVRIDIDGIQYIMDSLVFEHQGIKPMPFRDYFDLFMYPDDIEITGVRNE